MESPKKPEEDVKDVEIRLLKAELERVKEKCAVAEREAWNYGSFLRDVYTPDKHMLLQGDELITECFTEYFNFHRLLQLQCTQDGPFPEGCLVKFEERITPIANDWCRKLDYGFDLSKVPGNQSHMLAISLFQFIGTTLDSDLLLPTLFKTLRVINKEKRALYHAEFTCTLLCLFVEGLFILCSLDCGYSEKDIYSLVLRIFDFLEEMQSVEEPTLALYHCRDYLRQSFEKLPMLWKDGKKLDLTIHKSLTQRFQDRDSLYYSRHDLFFLLDWPGININGIKYIHDGDKVIIKAENKIYVRPIDTVRIIRDGNDRKNDTVTLEFPDVTKTGMVMDVKISMHEQDEDRGEGDWRQFCKDDFRRE